MVINTHKSFSGSRYEWGGAYLREEYWSPNPESPRYWVTTQNPFAILTNNEAPESYLSNGTVVSQETVMVDVFASDHWTPRQFSSLLIQSSRISADTGWDAQRGLYPQSAVQFSSVYGNSYYLVSEPDRVTVFDDYGTPVARYDGNWADATMLEDSGNIYIEGSSYCSIQKYSRTLDLIWQSGEAPHECDIASMAVYGDKLLALNERADQIEVYDKNSGSYLGFIKNDFRAEAIATFGKYIIQVAYDGITVIDGTTGQLFRQVDLPSNSYVSVAVDEVRRRIYLATDDRIFVSEPEGFVGWFHINDCIGIQEISVSDETGVLILTGRFQTESSDGEDSVVALSPSKIAEYIAENNYLRSWAEPSFSTAFESLSYEVPTSLQYTSYASYEEDVRRNIKNSAISILYDAYKEGAIGFIPAVVSSLAVYFGLVDLSYGPFSRTSFRNQYGVLRGQTAAYLANFFGFYDSDTNSVLINSDNADVGTMLTSPEYSAAVLHEMTHFWQDITFFEGSIADAETEAWIDEYVFRADGMDAAGLSDATDPTDTVIAAIDISRILDTYGGIRHDTMLGKILKAFQNLTGEAPSPEFRSWVAARSHKPADEARLAAFYMVDRDPRFEDQKQRLRESIINSRTLTDFRSAWLHYEGVFGNDELAQIFSANPPEGAVLDQSTAEEVARYAKLNVNDINWNDEEEVNLILSSQVLYYLYLAKNSDQRTYENYFMNKLWPALTRHFESARF